MATEIEYDCIRIEDTGKGIDPEIMPRLFKKFASKSEKGMGLGLFISKNIVEAHGGEIWADAPKKEKGEHFPLRFRSINP